MSDYTADPTNNPTTYELPDDGDLKPVSSVNPTLEGLADAVAHANWPEADATKKYPLASRSIVRVQGRLPVVDAAASWTYVKNPGAFDCQVNTAAELYHELDLPDGANLTMVQCWVKGAPLDAGLPATMPTINIFKIDITANSTTNVGSGTDASPSLAAYQGFHAVLATVGTIIDKTKYRYIAVFTSEAGAGANAGLRYFGCRCFITVTSQDPGGA
jgi:hypothetical protein